MPRGKLSQQTIEERRLARFAEFMAASGKHLGIKEPAPTVEELKDISEAKIDNTDELAIEAESVLLFYASKGEGFTRSICPECNRYFAYKYNVPSTRLKCSNRCRAAALKRIGIEWDYHKSPEERWLNNASGVIPMIVPPEAYEILQGKLQEAPENSSSQNL